MEYSLKLLNGESIVIDQAEYQQALDLIQGRTQPPAAGTASDYLEFVGNRRVLNIPRSAIAYLQSEDEQHTGRSL